MLSRECREPDKLGVPPQGNDSVEVANHVTSGESVFVKELQSEAGVILAARFP